MKTETRPETSTSDGTKNPNVRHLVKCLNPGVIAPPEYEDTALCGYIWDRLNVNHNGAICQKCVEISKTMGRV